MNYYNEFDPKAAAWLRELIRRGLIPLGNVDGRSITEIKAHELSKYTQCHFFAGIGGWSLALQIAGWPINRPVGTGSCPCQPFSAAGKGLGTKDERHLWPIWFKLICECRSLGQRWTDAIFGEQVESAINHGWLDSLSADMEGEDYSVGAAILGAHSVGAPHRRQRLYWVAYGQSQGRRDWERKSFGANGHGRDASGCGSENSVGDTAGGGCGVIRGEEIARSVRHTDGAEPLGVALGNANVAGPQGRRLQSGGEPNLFEAWTRGVDFIACTDGRKRLVKSGIFPLAHGFPSRVGILRGSGNAIVPQVAARFIEAAETARCDLPGRVAFQCAAQNQPLPLDE